MPEDKTEKAITEIRQAAIQHQHVRPQKVLAVLEELRALKELAVAEAREKARVAAAMQRGLEAEARKGARLAEQLQEEKAVSEGIIKTMAVQRDTMEMIKDAREKQLNGLRDAIRFASLKKRIIALFQPEVLLGEERLTADDGGSTKEGES